MHHEPSGAGLNHISSLRDDSVQTHESDPDLIRTGADRITPPMLRLAELDQQQIDQIVRTVPGGAANVQDLYPLTPLQEGILFHRLLDERNDAYVLSMLFELDSSCEVDSFLEALQCVFDRHDILRSAVHWQGLPTPVQVVYRHAAISKESIELDPCRDSVEQLRERMRPGAVVLDVGHAPIAKLQVTRRAEAGTCYALLHLHHLVCDHQTLNTIAAETLLFLEGRERELPRPVAYRSYVASLLKGPGLEQAESFFRDKLAAIEEPTAPFDLTGVYANGTRTQEARLVLPPARANWIRARARGAGVSAARLFHAAWALVIAKTAVRDDVVFGTVVLTQQQRGAQARRMLGMSVNTLPLRLQLKALSARELVEHTHRELVELLSHESAPLTLVQRCSGMKGNAPLFTAVLNFRHGGTVAQPSPLHKHSVRVVARGEAGSNYPIVLIVDDAPEEFVLTAQTHQPIDPQRLLEYFDTALQSLGQALEQAPQTPALSLSILSESAERELLDDFNRSEAAYSSDKVIHELFQEQVQRTPDSPAAEFEADSLSYRELNRRANQLARHLQAKGVGPDQLVALCMERGLNLVVGILAVLKAGGAYVPLDPSYPIARLALMVGEARPKVLLTQEHLRDRLPQVTAEVVSLDRIESELASQDAGDLDVGSIGLRPEHLAYVIFTSGSTGEPKGVLLQHRGLCNLAATQIRAFGVKRGSRVLQFASLSFDACTWEWVMALCAGGCLCLVNQEQLTPGEPLRDLLCTRRITHATLPPVAVGALPADAPLDDLGTLVVAGEACPSTLVSRWARGRNFINAYGPTETTVCATMHVCDPDERGAPPIGKPIQNTQIYILDPHLQPVPIGVVGEIYVGGVSLARGYLNRPELTQMRFVRSPFGRQSDSRIYKTGDLGKWHANGAIEYLGRNDHQIKIRGFRVELGEIEAQLTRHPLVKEAVVIAREEGSSGKRLIAYVIGSVSNDTTNPSAQALRVYLKSELPDYMVPAAFVTLERFPLTANGKLDRQALPAPDLEAFAKAPYEAPYGEVENALAGIWQRLLRIVRVSRHDNFFELGGHSLLIVQMAERLRRAGFSTDVRRIFATPVLADLAATLTRDYVEPFQVPPNLIAPNCGQITPQMLPLVDLSPAQIEWITQQMPGGANNIQDIYPLVPLQEGMLFQHLLDGQSGDVYVVPTLMAVSSRERMSELIAALQRVLDRHDILRSVMLWEPLLQPVQVVLRRAELPVEVLELDPGRDFLEQMRERMRPGTQRIDLCRALPLRLQIATDSQSGACYALLQLHHIVGDATLHNVVLAEAVAYLEHREGDLLESLPYRNHVARQLELAKSGDDATYFRAKLADINEPTAPFGILDTRENGSRLVEASKELPSALSNRTRSQAQLLGVSAATLFHASWGLVVARTSGRDDVVFGSVLGSSQGNTESAQMMGLFINTLPIRLRLRDVTAGELIKLTQRELIEAMAHEHSSLALAQQVSGIKANAPLFTTILNYRRSLRRLDGAPVADGITVVASGGFTNYPITLSVDDTNGPFSLTAQTDCELAPRRITDYVQAALRALLRALETAPETPALTLSILPEGEWDQVIHGFNATQSPFPSRTLVHELFEEQVRNTPTAIAIAHGESHLSYADLNGRANRLARDLRGMGIGPSDTVGICVERSVEMIVGLLGTLKAGGAYLSLDPNYPQDRLRHMLQDAEPQVLLVQKELLARLPATRSAVIDLTARLRQLGGSFAENLPPHELGQTVDDSVYVIYTSGSTGRPKGTVMPHRAMVNFIEWHRRKLDAAAGAAGRVLQFAALSFDVAFQEIFSTLCTGGTLVMIDEWIRKDARTLEEFLRERSIERLFLPPLMLQSLAEYCAFAERVPVALKDVITAGEQLRITPEVAQFFTRLEKCHLHNHYGPTESHVVTALTLEREPEHWPALPSIGRPIDNARIYILDHYNQPLPVGVTGELHIGGVGLARGYLNRPELTVERFIGDPFTTESNGRLYRTGDLACWREDGTLEYLGRNDDQVKIRGFRIELGEIEARLMEHRQVKEAAVVAQDKSPGEKRLVAYIVRRGASDGPPPEELRQHLKATLPAHMIPSAFVILKSLPLTPSGKLDRRALPVPEPQAYGVSGYEPPKGAVETLLAEIWQALLQVDRVGRDDNFFELGGHSLLAVKVLVKINQSFNSNLRVTEIYGKPTLRELAALLSGDAREDRPVDLSREAALESMSLSNSRPRSIPDQTILLTGGTGFVGRFLLEQLLHDTDAIIYCLIREPTVAAASARLRNTLVQWELWSDTFDQRLIAIPGDLSKPRLGVGDSTYQALCQQVDSIYHCGTSMNHLETYSMAKPANVGSARALLELATRGKLKLINHVSTLGVFRPMADQSLRVVTELTPIDGERHLHSQGYVASKWVSEKLFMTASQQGIPCNLFRLGLIWADAQRGRYDERQREYRLLKSAILAGCGIKDYRYSSPPTPVDYAARAVVSLAQRQAHGQGVFHISTANSMTRGLFEHYNEAMGTPLELLSEADWICEIKRLHHEGSSLPIVPLIEFAFSMDQPAIEAHLIKSRFASIRFDCTRTYAEIRSTGGSLTISNDDLLPRGFAGMLQRDPDLRAKP